MLRACARCWSACPMSLSSGSVSGRAGCGSWSPPRANGRRVAVGRRIVTDPRCRAGGSAGVRSGRSSGVAQAALALPDVSTVVDRAETRDRVEPVPVDDQGSEVGDAPGRSPRPLGRRGRRRSRVRLTHRDGRRDALRDSADRRPCTVRGGHLGMSPRSGSMRPCSPAKARFPAAVLVDPDRRRPRRAAPRHRRRSRQRRVVPMVRCPARGVAHRDRVGGLGSVGVVSHRVRHDAPRRDPGCRPLPRHPARQHGVG